MLVEQEREAEGKEKLINLRRLIRNKSDANWLKMINKYVISYSSKKCACHTHVGIYFYEKFWLIILYDIKLYDKIFILRKILFYSEVNI